MTSFPALVAVTGAAVMVAGSAAWILHPWRPGVRGAALKPQADDGMPAAGASQRSGGRVLIPVAIR